MVRAMKILGHTYSVIESTKETQVMRGTTGTCCTGTLEIKLDPSAPQTRYEESFLHEIFEALNYHLQLDLEHGKMSALCEGVFSVLQDNGMKTNWYDMPRERMMEEP